MYYPKSQIKTNLYTNGEQYILSTTKVGYIGYYYEVSSGKKYTGKTPQDGPNILLTPFSTPFSNSEDLDSLNNSSPQDSNIYPIPEDGYLTTETFIRYIPPFNLTLPTTQDKQNGQFLRYFCKKNNELKYLEIDKLTHDKLQSQDPQIAWDLYTPTSILWQIKGNKEQVYNSNKGTVISAERNLRWNGFSQYFQDKFLKYHLES